MRHCVWRMCGVSYTSVVNERKPPEFQNWTLDKKPSSCLILLNRQLFTTKVTLLIFVEFGTSGGKITNDSIVNWWFHKRRSFRRKTPDWILLTRAFDCITHSVLLNWRRGSSVSLSTAWSNLGYLHTAILLAAKCKYTNLYVLFWWNVKKAYRFP